MMSNLDKLRKLNEQAKVEKVQDFPPATSKGGTNPPNESTERPAPPQGSQASKGSITYRCGHAQRTDWFAGQDCKLCIQKRREDKRLTKAAKRNAGHEKDKGSKHFEKHGRLPDGSKFEVAYDAEQTMWRGSLSVPIPDDPSKRLVGFNGSDSGLFRLEQNLDAAWREWKATQTKEEAT